MPLRHFISVIIIDMHCSIQQDQVTGLSPIDNY
jgi:hypothetical protein